jgi:hypothetical protein
MGQGEGLAAARVQRGKRNPAERHGVEKGVSRDTALKLHCPPAETEK